MARYLMCALTQPRSPSSEDEFNRWYSDEHVPDVLDVPGILSAQRFRLLPEGNDLSFPHRYFALYEVETDDLKSVDDDIRSRRGSDTMRISDSIAASISQRFFIEAMGPKVTREDVPPAPEKA